MAEITGYLLTALSSNYMSIVGVHPTLEAARKQLPEGKFISCASWHISSFDEFEIVELPSLRVVETYSWAVDHSGAPVVTYLKKDDVEVREFVAENLVKPSAVRNEPNAPQA